MSPGYRRTPTPYGGSDPGLAQTVSGQDEFTGQVGVGRGLDQVHVLADLQGYALRRSRSHEGRHLHA